MSAGLAFAAAVCGVLAAWEAVSALGALGTRLGAVIAPLSSGREPGAGERRRLLVTGAAAVFAAGWLLAGPLAGVAMATAAPLAVRRALAVSAARRRRRIVAAAPALARAIADALAGGSSIRAALAGAHRGGIVGPARDELVRVERSLELGETTEGALERLRAIAADPAYDAVAAAILLQREAGGDLARLLRRLATTIEADVRAHADARSLTAQARFSAWLVACLPVAAAALTELAAPGSIGALVTQPLSAALTVCAVVLQLIAAFVIRRVVRPQG